MSAFDVRSSGYTEIDQIRFSDNVSIQKNTTELPSIYDEGRDYEIPIRDKKEAEYMILALQKAIELGWWDKWEPRFR